MKFEKVSKGLGETGVKFDKDFAEMQRGGTNSAVATADAMPADEARPLGITECHDKV